MEKKLKVADFAALIGSVPKTVYNLLDNETILKEIVIERGRKVTYIITNDKQIEELRNIYGKNKYNELHHYENEIQSNNIENSQKENAIQNKDNEIQNKDNEVQNLQLQAIFNNTLDKFLELSNNYNETILNLQNELMDYRERIPLLEDKAGREGVYLQEIKDLEEDNKVTKKVIERQNKILIRFIVISLIIFIMLIITSLYLYFNPREKIQIQEKQVTKVITLDKNGKPVSILTEQN